MSNKPTRAPQPPPAGDRSRVHDALREHVADASPGQPLPTDRQHAARFGVSTRTVARIMKQLVDEGLVVRVRGKGSFTAPLESRTMPPPPAGAAGDLAASIRRDIVQGALTDGQSLPAVKFLCRELHVSPSTVSRAYRLLADEGLVSRIGQTYHVGRFSDIVYRRRAGEVLVYLSPDPSGTRSLSSRSYGTAFHRMEDLLARTGYTVRYRAAGRLARDITAIADGPPPRGMVLVGVDPGSWEGLEPRLRRLRRRFGASELPIVCDWTTGDHLPAQTLVTPIAGLGEALSQRMARFLVGRQWRRATFVIDSDHFRHTGRYCNLWDFLALRPALHDICAEFQWRLVVVRTTPVPDWDSVGLQLPESVIARAVSGPTPVSASEAISEIQCVDALSDALPEHAQHSDCLVFQRDEYAAQALEWLHEGRIDVPGSIALVSTDDDPAWYHLGLSRVEIDWDGLGVLMAHCLIDPTRIARDSSGLPQVPVRVIEKQTS